MLDRALTHGMIRSPQIRTFSVGQPSEAGILSVGHRKGRHLVGSQCWYVGEGADLSTTLDRERSTSAV